MTALDALKALKKFISDYVASKTLLQQEDSEPPVYVNPYVEMIYLPHKNFSPQDFQVPFILVGLDDAIDDTLQHELNIRITFATYGGGQYTDENGLKVNMPDSKGYIDLINIIERTKLELITAGIINGAGAVLKPFRYGVYDTEMVYPYWYGYLSFTLDIPATEYITEREDINYGL